MTDILDKDLRMQIKEFLQNAFRRTIRAYEDGKIENADVPLKHIGILLKLAEAAQIPDAAGDGMELAMLIQQASAEVDRYKERKGHV